jgi:hypothetical protein
MKKFTIILTLFFIALGAQIGFGQNAANDKETLIKAARFLEQKPFDKDAKKIREWAMFYVIQTKDVSVVLCGGDLTKAMFDKKNKNGTELLGQYTIGMAAFKLENPDRKTDENAAQLAGIESALKAYEAMIAEKPKTKFEAMDELLVKRDKGELKATVDAANCGKKDDK